MTLAFIVGLLAPILQGILAGTLKPRLAIEQVVSTLLNLVGVNVTPQGLDGILSFLEAHAGAPPKTTQEIIDWFEANGFSATERTDGWIALHQEPVLDPGP